MSASNPHWHPIKGVLALIVAVVVLHGLWGDLWGSSTPNQPTPSTTVNPNLGQSYYLHFGYPLCVGSKGIGAIDAALIAKDTVGERHAMRRYACFGTGVFVTSKGKVLLIALGTGFSGFGLVRVRFPSGTAYWINVEALKPL